MMKLDYVLLLRLLALAETANLCWAAEGGASGVDEGCR